MFDLIIIISGGAYKKCDIVKLREKFQNNIINGSKGYVVLCKKLAISEEPSNKSSTVARAKEIIEKAGLKKKTSSKILILSHRQALEYALDSQNEKELEDKELKELRINNAEVWVFHHDSSSIWAHIASLIKDLGEVKNCKGLNELIAEFEKSYKTEAQIPEKIKNLSLLKHRLIHLFLSIDIDLQKIGEILDSQKEKKQKEEEAKTYFAKTVSKKNLESKIGEAKKLVEGDNEATDDILKKGINGVVEVDKIQDKKKKGVVKGILGQIRCLLEKDPDIQKLSGIIDKVNKDGEGFGNLKTYLKEAKKGNRKSFNDWLCDLDDCLDRLREAIQSK